MMTSIPAGQPDLKQRATFKWWMTMPLRYQDLDTLGHVNNAAMPMFFEQARTEFFEPLLRGKASTGLDTVIARVVVDYLAEIHYPGCVDIGMTCTRIGNKAFTLAHGVFTKGTGHCVGTGEAVMLIFDLKARKSIAIPAEVRAALSALSPA
jgi:acyl-CoA thioester hydrolase